MAIKVLPRSVAHDSERLARFHREARVLATLNHPNVAQVFGFAEDEGTHFLVIELAEGETLAERIAKGPVPEDDAVAIAIQIARALEAAHERGIVHRDLKPANVHVSGDASVPLKVKVLDFGLAKALAPPGASGDFTNSPTLTQQTADGTLLGTAAYMAPEQARGQEADTRADIWALGCVLYEMLAGRRAFQGTGLSDILASVLRDEPAIDELELSFALERVLRRCLEKSPAQRWQHVGDVRLELEEVAGGAGMEGERPRAHRSGRALWTTALAVGSACLAVGWLAALRLGGGGVGGGDSVQKPFWVTVDAPLPGTGGAIAGNSVAISRDGRRLAVGGKARGGGRIYVREASEDEFRPLAQTHGAGGPEFSSDGNWILFASRFGPSRIPFQGRERFDWRDPYDRSTECEEMGENCQGRPAPLTDSNARVWCALRDEQFNLWLKTDEVSPTLLVEDACHPIVLGSRLLFVRLGEIWAAGLAKEGLIDAGPMATGIRVFQMNRGGAGHYSVADNGRWPPAPLVQGQQDAVLPRL